MKAKKILIFIFIMLLIFSNIAMAYEKTNSINMTKSENEEKTQESQLHLEQDSISLNEQNNDLEEEQENEFEIENETELEIKKEDEPKNEKVLNTQNIDKSIELNNQENIKLELSKEIIRKQTIEDGEYEIRSAKNENMILDIDAGSNENCARLQIWGDADVEQQRFIVSYIGNGYYKIVVKKSNKVIDVQGAGTQKGTPVQQYENNNTDAQKWIIQETEDGYYNIISKCNELYMDCSEEQIKCGTKILMNEFRNEKSQKFIFDKVLKDKGEQTLENGEYEIRCAINESKVLDIDGGSYLNCARLQIWGDADVEQQRFIINYIGDGFYTIEVRRSQKMLDVQGAGLKEETPAQQYDRNNTDAQKWIIKDVGDGYYNIISKCNGLYMSIVNNEAQDGTKITLKKSNNSNLQKFKFDKVLKDKGTKTLDDGVYKIQVYNDSNMIFDIDGGSTNSGAKLQLWNEAYVPQQRFIINYIGDGYYSIISKKSKKVLDVQYAGIQNKTPVQQYDNNNTDAQKWIIKDIGNGYYNIISKCNGYYVTASKNECGTKMFMNEYNSAYIQKFKFEEAPEKKGIDVSHYQGNIDWKAVKNDGIDFAFIRVGYRGYATGVIVRDSKFEYNIKNAISNNINCGVYFYSQAVNEQEAIQEADFVINLVKDYNITYPIVIDSEYSNSLKVGRADRLSVEERTRICEAFCERVKSSGYEPMVYANKYWFYDNLNINKLSKYKIWLAHYVDGAPIKKTDYKYAYYIWQYTDSGRVNGISEDVDLDIQYN